MRTESPRGEIGFYLVSDGSEKPLRCKGRSPCFTAISVIDEIGSNALVADTVAIVGSLDIVLGEIDR
jgi:NADH-quinone oxidoreductase subunit D